MTLHQLYAEALNAPSDIRQHLNKLGSLAAGQRVVEFGTRRGTSTLALLASFLSQMAAQACQQHRQTASST